MSAKDATRRPPTPASNGLTYRQAGVDIDAGEALVEAIKPLARSTDRPGTLGGLGGFGALFDLKAAGFVDPLLVSGTDGVGTKLKLAIEADRHDTVGIDLVAMCVNDLLAQGATPLFFLDYYATGKLSLEAGRAVVAGIAEGCRQAGCALIGGETAEMPGLYAEGDYDLAGFAVGAVERERLLPRGDVEAGDLLIGVASSGAHSNGFSLIRRIVEVSGLSLQAEAPFAPGQSLAAALLTPTRIYARPLLPLFAEGRIKALAHITGGGLPGNLPRVLPDGLVAELDAGAWPIPALFDWLMRTGGVAALEMLRTFNCGLGLVLVTSATDAPRVLSGLAALPDWSGLIGRIQPRGPGDGALRLAAEALPWRG